MSTLHNKYFGKSLIELLAVIIILAILTAIAIPTYTTYNAKAKVSTALQVLEKYKMRTVKLMVKTGAIPTTYDILFPDNNTTGRIDDNNKTVSFKYVDRVSAYIVSGSVLLGARLLTGGAITATNNYVYIAYQNNKWSCGISSTHTDNVIGSVLPQICYNTTTNTPLSLP